MRGGNGPDDPASQEFSSALCTPEGAGTDTTGGGAAVLLGWGAGKVTQSPPNATAWSWVRRWRCAGRATPSGSCSFEAIYDRFELKRTPEIYKFITHPCSQRHFKN